MFDGPLLADEGETAASPIGGTLADAANAADSPDRFVVGEEPAGRRGRKRNGLLHPIGLAARLPAFASMANEANIVYECYKRTSFSML